MSHVAVRFGEADLTTCDREPIHIPGSIQPHGVLLVIDRDLLAVEQVAGDTQMLLGRDHAALLGQSVAAVFEPDTADFIRSQLSSRSDFVAPVVRLGFHSSAAGLPLDMTLHASSGTAIIEIESAKRAAGAGGEPIVELKTLIAAVQHTATLGECCSAAATAMRAATGFDRAMVYRFLPDGSGEVAAESATAGLETFLGLHYPASDIPAQARELYRRNWLRAIPDIDYRAAPLVPPINPRTAEPIDMSHCDLRSVSPIHLEYLRNMGVCASLSASIVFQEKLWGMLVLHHYAPLRVSADLRVACETFAMVLSLQVQAKVQAETAIIRDDARRTREALVERLDGAHDIGATLASLDLLKYLGASGAVVHLEGRFHHVGETPRAAEIADLVKWLNLVNRPLFQTEQLSVGYPPAAEFAAVGSGLLAVGLSREPRDYVLWFRPEIGRTVRWAGDPSKPTTVDRHGFRLTPRGSFAEWLEVTRRQAAPWSDVEIDLAEALRVVFLETVLKSVDIAQRERRQIARDLHDDLGQTLAAAQIRISMLSGDERPDVRATASVVGELIDRANGAIRSLAAQLSPHVLHELGLCRALEWLSEDIERTFGLRVTLVDHGLSDSLAQEARSILYRAARELLINVAKHARTDSAVVEVEVSNEELMVTVSDAGIGYDPDADVGGERRGLGLISLRETLSSIGGNVTSRSSRGAGTVVILRTPLTAGSPPAGKAT